MISPSRLRAIAVQPPAEAGKAAEAPSVRRPEEEASPRKPVTDEYVPEEKEEPSGRYWPGRDEGGQPRIYFDAPEDAAVGSEKPDGGPAAAFCGRPRRIVSRQRVSSEPGVLAAVCVVVLLAQLPLDLRQLPLQIPGLFPVGFGVEPLRQLLALFPQPLDFPVHPSGGRGRW